MIQLHLNNFCVISYSIHTDKKIYKYYAVNINVLSRIIEFKILNFLKSLILYIISTNTSSHISFSL